MRAWFVLLAVTLTATAGCLDNTDSNRTDAPTEPPTMAPADLPEDIDESNTVLLGADPFNAVNGVPCSQAVSSCFHYPFTVNSTVTVDALLEWTLPVNDFDLYLYKGSEEVSREGINNIGDPPETSQVMPDIQLAPGDYEFIVVAWNAVEDTYHLTATFRTA